MKMARSWLFSRRSAARRYETKRSVSAGDDVEEIHQREEDLVELDDQLDRQAEARYEASSEGRLREARDDAAPERALADEDQEQEVEDVRREDERRRERHAAMEPVPGREDAGEVEKRREEHLPEVIERAEKVVPARLGPGGALDDEADRAEHGTEPGEEEHQERRAVGRSRGPSRTMTMPRRKTSPATSR